MYNTWKQIIWLQVIVPLIEPLTDQQRLDASNLGQSCQQAEDALSQGMDKLQQTLADTVAAGQLLEGTYIPQMATAMEKMEALVSFVNQVMNSTFLISSIFFCRNYVKPPLNYNFSTQTLKCSTLPPKIS